MNTAILEMLTSQEEEEALSDPASTQAELVEKWIRRAAFLEAFALDCRERQDAVTALVLDAVAQTHRSNARELQAQLEA